MKKPGVFHSFLDLNVSLADAGFSTGNITSGTGNIIISNLMFDSKLNAYKTAGFDADGGYIGKMEFGFKTVSLAVKQCKGDLVNTNLYNKCLVLGVAVLEGFLFLGLIISPLWGYTQLIPRNASIKLRVG